jgi:hypothetical protein
MVMVSVINESLFSGFFFVMLVICIVSWFFTTVFYSFPMWIIKMITKPKRPKNADKKNIKKIVELTSQFTRYKKARI